MAEPPLLIPRDEFRSAITGSYEEVREQFAEHLGPGIENFVLLSYKAYERIQTMEARTPSELRSAWTYQFLFGALNSMITAFHLQISGFIAPAGNLMRQFGEYVAMALLCSHRAIDVFDRVQREQEKFPAHKAIGLVQQRRNARLLRIDTKAWNDLKQINSFYDGLSHGGVYGVSASHIFEYPGAKSLGGTFDSKKLDFYNREMRLSHTAAMRLIDTTSHCEHLLNSSTGADIADGTTDKPT